MPMRAAVARPNKFPAPCARHGILEKTVEHPDPAMLAAETAPAGMLITRNAITPPIPCLCEQREAIQNMLKVLLDCFTAFAKTLLRSLARDLIHHPVICEMVAPMSEARSHAPRTRHVPMITYTKFIFAFCNWLELPLAKIN